MKKISSFKNLVEEIDSFQNAFTLHPNFLFRGQASADWSLLPSFSRIAAEKRLDRDQALQLERECVTMFAISSQQFLSYSTHEKLFGKKEGWDFMGGFVQMQHFSAPTRKLDWSVSPWVALYFACFEKPDCDGSLWIIDYNKTNIFFNEKAKKNGFENLEKGINQFLDPKSIDLLCSTTSMIVNTRIEAQKSRFTVATNLLTDHFVLLDEAKTVDKIIISKELKSEIMIQLNSMNIHAKSLFPNIDGLGRSIKEFARFWPKSIIQ
jgi:hypothetical protein